MFEYLLVLLLTIWFVASVVVQLNVWEGAPPAVHRNVRVIHTLDVLGAVPSWNFFAPNPGTTDYHLLYRDRLDSGEISDWREAPIDKESTLLKAIWNPGKRKSKVLADVIGIVTQAVTAARRRAWEQAVEELKPDFSADTAPGPDDVYWPAGACFAVGAAGGGYLTPAAGGTFGFAAATPAAATPLRLRAADLGHYVLYDPDRRLWLATAGSPEAAASAKPGNWVLNISADKDLVRIAVGAETSDAVWALERAFGDTLRLRHVNSGRFLATGGPGGRGTATLGGRGGAAAVTLEATDGCAEYPELALDAEGAIAKTTWEDGSLYGVADVHSHLFTNLAFGGGGVFHGAPYHPLGVEHALEDCDQAHGLGGNRDLVGFFLSDDLDLNVEDALPVLTRGRVEGFKHDTSGYPDFVFWPNAWRTPTHQVQYYRWIERAYLGGLRLIVQLATGNSALCEGLVGLGSQTAPYGCNDMDTVDRTLLHTRGLERYIDAQHGGPGKGWLRVVETPQQARDAVVAGKLAVVLGIEISNLFDCFVTPPPGMERCDADDVRERVAEYHAKGVRVIFPVHKFDNGFAPGDGSRGILELGNVLNSGLYTNFTQTCPDFEHTFDKGGLSFAGLNKPRSEYFARPMFDMTELSTNLELTMLPLLPALLSGSADGEWCQATGLTDIGRVLIEALMAHGMVIDVAHLPKHAVMDALDILVAARYPVLSTHGNTMDGRVYDVGGIRGADFGGCAALDRSASLVESFANRTHEAREFVDLPAMPLSFDYNGFAGSRRPRFGPDSGCPQPQTNPVAYPFASHDGGVTFTQATLGNRRVDFNTEGMLHLGLLPELIEDVRRDGANPADIEPLFRTAEAFITLWERIEAAAPR